MLISASSRSRSARHGVKTHARRTRSRRSPTWSPSRIRRARSWRCSSATSSPHQNFQSKGIVPFKLGHVAFHVTDVKQVTKFYCDVLGFRESDWMADFFSFLRCGPDHHTINLMETGCNRHFHTAFELRDWGHMQTPATSSASTATSCCGAPAGTASATICSPITAPRMASSPNFRRARPDKRGARLFRAAARGTATSRSGRRCGRRTLQPRICGASCPATR